MDAYGPEMFTSIKPDVYYFAKPREAIYDPNAWEEWHHQALSGPHRHSDSGRCWWVAHAAPISRGGGAPETSPRRHRGAPVGISDRRSKRYTFRPTVPRLLRSITLLAITQKLFAKVLLHFLGSLAALREEWTFGFRAGYQPSELTLTIMSLVEASKERRRPLHIIRTDLTKAYLRQGDGGSADAEL